MVAENSREPKAILLVEDDESVATFTSRALELEGHRVFLTSSGNQAIETVQKEHIDLVLLDLMLADIDEGWGVLEKITVTPKLSAIPVIVYSAAIEQPNQERALSMGAVAFLTKPIGVAELKEAVNKAFAQASGGTGA